MAGWRQAADAMQLLVAPPALATVQALDALDSIRCYVGWPDPNKLLTDLRAATATNAHISIYAAPGSRLTSRYGKDPSVTKVNATENVLVNGNVITITGARTPGDNIFAYINGQPVQTTVIAGDTTTALATRLAAAINTLGGGISASHSVSQVTVTGAYSVNADAFGQGTFQTEVTRIAKRLQVTIWAADNVVRDALLEGIIPTLAGAEFLTYADGSKGRILFQGEMLDMDRAMPSGVMRADTFWEVEFAYYLTGTGTQVGAVCKTITPITPLEQVLGFIGNPITLPYGGPPLQLIILKDHGAVLGQIATLDFEGNGIVATRLGTDGTATVTISGGTGNIKANVLLTRLSATQYQFPETPALGSETIFVDTTTQLRVASSPALNSYTIAGNTVTFGYSIDPAQLVWSTYAV